MAHFAQLDQLNTVIRVISVGDSDCLDENGNECEDIGICFCKSLYGENSRWIQTSYNNNIRVRYAGIGYTYDETFDAFIPPKPYESWILNTETLEWDPPVPPPDEEGIDIIHEWNEETVSWNIIRANQS